jgi:predicted N-acetyltransferase YhbS
VIIRRAVEEDIPVVRRLRAEAVRWLAQLGSDQWQKPWPDETRAGERLRESVQDGDTWIAEEDGEPIATLALDDFADPQLWTEAERAEPAKYLHRLVVARARSGSGIGARLVDWACDRAAREGARWVRADVWTTNHALHRYYTTHGFRHVRTRTETDYPSGALFQRPAARQRLQDLIEMDT